MVKDKKIGIVGGVYSLSSGLFEIDKEKSILLDCNHSMLLPHYKINIIKRTPSYKNLSSICHIRIR